MSVLVNSAYVPEMLLGAPREVIVRAIGPQLARCRGVCFIKVYRIGVIVTVRAGKGVILRKIPTAEGGYEWSAPCALTFAGPALGASIGIERTNFIIFLMNENDIDALLNGTLAMGLNAAGALGPFGRTGEALVAPGSSGVLVYADSSGIYGGVSLEFTGIFVDRIANYAQYGSGTTAGDILQGRVGKPTGEVFERMYESLKSNTLVEEGFQQDTHAAETTGTDYADAAVAREVPRQQAKADT